MLDFGEAEQHNVQTVLVSLKRFASMRRAVECCRCRSAAASFTVLRATEGAYGYSAMRRLKVRLRFAIAACRVVAG